MNQWWWLCCVNGATTPALIYFGHLVLFSQAVPSPSFLLSVLSCPFPPPKRLRLTFLGLPSFLLPRYSLSSLSCLGRFHMRKHEMWAFHQMCAQWKSGGAGSPSSLIKAISSLNVLCVWKTKGGHPPPKKISSKRQPLYKH